MNKQGILFELQSWHVSKSLVSIVLDKTQYMLARHVVHPVPKTVCSMVQSIGLYTEILAYRIGISRCRTATLTRVVELGIVHIKGNFR